MDLQPRLKGLGCRVVVIPGQHHAGNIQAEVPENVDKPDHIQVVGNAQIPPDFVLFNVRGVDGNDHLHLVL